MQIREYRFLSTDIECSLFTTGMHHTIYLQAGLLAPGSFYLPLPSRVAKRHSGFLMAFVPGYSGGSATDLHRLPF